MSWFNKPQAFIERTHFSVALMIFFNCFRNSQDTVLTFFLEANWLPVYKCTIYEASGQGAGVR